MRAVTDGDVDKVLGFLYNRHTIATYRSALQEFVGIALDSQSIQAVVAGWSAASKATITVRMAALRRLVSHMASIGECDPLVLKSVTTPSGRPSAKRRSLTDQELDAFLDAAKTEEELLLAIIMFDTGLRAGFIPRIRYKDLEGTSFMIRVKNAADVEVFVTEEMTRLSTEIRERAGVSRDAFLLSNKEVPISYDVVYSMFSRMAKRAGIQNVTPHSARHTFATRLAKAGVPIPEISALMGHKKLDTTMRYVHPSRSSMESAVKNIAISRRQL